MPHPIGERLRGDACGAEIVFEKACPCPDREPQQHYDVCCGKPMRNVGVGPQASESPPQAGHH